jgi:hypothetical protein
LRESPETANFQTPLLALLSCAQAAVDIDKMRKVTAAQSNRRSDAAGFAITISSLISSIFASKRTIILASGHGHKSIGVNGLLKTRKRIPRRLKPGSG